MSHVRIKRLIVCTKKRLYIILWPAMGWLRLVGSLKLQVSFAKEPCKREDILQKRTIILRSLLIVATPQVVCSPVKLSTKKVPVSYVNIINKHHISTKICNRNHYIYTNICQKNTSHIHNKLTSHSFVTRQVMYSPVVYSEKKSSHIHKKVPKKPTHIQKHLLKKIMTYPQQI